MKQPTVYTSSQKDPELAVIDLNKPISAKQRAFLEKLGIISKESKTKEQKIKEEK